MKPATDGTRTLRPELLALALAGMLAPSLPVAAAQHPSTSARPHPAAGTHAVASAAEANAKRIEACGEASDGLIAALRKGDFKAATAGFDVQMRNLVDPMKLQAAWASLGTQFGVLRAVGEPHSALYGNDPVVVTVMRFDKGDVAAQVACGPDGRIAGFYMRPAPAVPARASGSGG